jgi:tripartite-type tricarboxylate transporter receptor subunit TctC
VGYPAGGGADVSARQLSGPLQAVLGQSVVVENRSGASGYVATQNYLRHDPDGYNLLVVTGNDAVMNPIVQSSAKYEPTDLRMLHPLILSDVVLVTGRDDAPDDIDELIERMRQPGGPEYSFGNWGVGSTSHLAAVDFRIQAMVKVLDVPYGGIAPIVQDLLGKQIDYAFIPLISTVLDMVESGRLKVVSIATRTRNPSLPNVPAAGESQILESFEYHVGPAVFVHKNTPEAIVQTLHEAVAGVVNSEKYQKWSVDTGNRPMTPMNLAQAEAFYHSELERSQRLAAAIGLTAK